MNSVPSVQNSMFKHMGFPTPMKTRAWGWGNPSFGTAFFFLKWSHYWTGMIALNGRMALPRAITVQENTTGERLKACLPLQFHSDSLKGTLEANTGDWGAGQHGCWKWLLGSKVVPFFQTQQTRPCWPWEYCSTLCMGLPLKKTLRQQLVRNSAGHLPMWDSWTSHTTADLDWLHWFWVWYKVLFIIFKAL